MAPAAAKTSLSRITKERAAQGSTYLLCPHKNIHTYTFQDDHLRGGVYSGIYSSTHRGVYSGI
jgi:hypothetical protein